jgi:hypothetical protein
LGDVGIRCDKLLHQIGRRGVGQRAGCSLFVLPGRAHSPDPVFELIEKIGVAGGLKLVHS